MTRILKLLIIISSAMILTLSIIIGMKYYEIKQREFLLRYLTPIATDSLLNWSKYYGFERNWLKIFSLLMTESEGQRKRISPKQCKGYMQLQDRTAQILRDRLREKISRTGPFDTEFNIAGGILFLRDIYDSAGMRDWILTIEQYNTGIYNYQIKGKRAPNHVKRYSISETYYKWEWKKYLMPGMD